MHNQTHLEQRLQRIQEVLNFDDADEDFLEEEQKRNEAIAEDQEETKGNTEPIVSKRNSTWPEFIAEKELPNFLEMYFPDGTEPPIEDVMNYSLTVPDEVREHFIYLQQCMQNYLAFMKHPQWVLYSKSSDKQTRLYSRVSDSNLLCLKSISFCRGGVQ
jgi:hypothetical protein